jgi:hypothetical protein
MKMTNNQIEKLKQDIFAECKKGGVSFVELSRIENFKGDFCMHVPGIPNAVLWSNISSEAADVLSELIRERKIEPTPTTPLVYLIDGQAINLPIVKPSQRVFKKPVWVPMVFNLTKSAKNAPQAMQ